MKDFKFDYNQAIEFQNVLIALNAQDYFYQFLEEDNLKFFPLVDDYIKKMSKKLTMYQKWELNYFFNMGDFMLYSIGRMIYMYYILNNEQVKTIDDLIDVIEESDSVIFDRAILLFHSILTNQKVDLNNIRNHTHIDILNIVSKSSYEQDEIKNKVIECLENSQESKQRYCLLLKSIYHKIYVNYEKEIKTMIEDKISDYEKRFQQNPGDFTRNYLKTEYDVFRDKVYVSISYFWNIGFEYWPKQKGADLIILGVQAGIFPKSIPKKDKIFYFLNTISDKSRLAILYLLKDRPYYVNELAEKLNISTATISYHLSKLQDLNIVDCKRKDQRIYYYLLGKNLKEKMYNSLTLFTKD